MSGEKTHSWGKIAVKKTSILKVKHPLHSQFEKNCGLENTIELPSIAG
jgi:hypothetical protein